MLERERLAARRWFTRVSIGSEALGEGCDRLRDCVDDAALGRDEDWDEAAMMTVERDGRTIVMVYNG